MTVYGYIRVSTDKQTTQNQRFEVEQYLKTQNKSVDVWINETISGTVCYKKRKIGGTMKRLRQGDVLICSELSRLGRTILDILTILNICVEKQVEVWTVKERYRLGNDIQSQMMAFVFSMLAQLERALISQRTKEALARLKAEGRKLGRQKGSKNKRCKSDGIKEKILTDRKNGLSGVQIAKKYDIGKSTVYRLLSQSNVGYAGTAYHYQTRF